MTHPDFTFNEKAGELKRGEDMLLPLSIPQAQVFAVLWRSRFKNIRGHEIGDQLGWTVEKVWHHTKALRKRIRAVGLRLKVGYGNANGGYRLYSQPMPKWKPIIAPPVTLERRQ